MTVADLIAWCGEHGIDIVTCRISPMEADVEYVGYDVKSNLITLEEDAGYEDDFDIWTEV